jgi:hypothetical protein
MQTRRRIFILLRIRFPKHGQSFAHRRRCCNDDEKEGLALGAQAESDGKPGSVAGFAAKKNPAAHSSRVSVSALAIFD